MGSGPSGPPLLLGFSLHNARPAQPRPIEHAAVLGAVKAKPFGWPRKTRPALTAPARGGCQSCGRDGRMLAARVELKNDQKEGTTRPSGAASSTNNLISSKKSPRAILLPRPLHEPHRNSSKVPARKPSSSFAHLILPVPYSCVTTDHACALSGSAKLSTGGFVLASVKG